MVLQPEEGDNRRSDYADYGSYEYYEDGDYDTEMYVDHNIYDDSQENLEQINVEKGHKEDIFNHPSVPDKVFGNVMYAMASEITDTNGMLKDSTEVVTGDVESLDAILALPLVGDDEVNDEGYTDLGSTLESMETRNMHVGDSEILGPKADQILGESFQRFKTPFRNLIHRDLYLKK